MKVQDYDNQSVNNDCPEPNTGGSGGWRVFVVLLGVIGIGCPMLYNMYRLMGPIGLGNGESVRSLQGIESIHIQSYFDAHPEVFDQTMRRGFETNPDAFVAMLVRSGLFQFQRPRHSFMQRSLQSATRGISSFFGRKEHHMSQNGDNITDEGSLI